MKKLITAIFILISISAYSQSYQAIGTPGMQRKISGSDTTYRFSSGSYGFTYFKSLSAMKAYLNDKANIAGGNRITGNQIITDINGFTGVFVGNSVVKGESASTTALRWTSLVSSALDLSETNLGVNGSLLQKGSPVNPFTGINLVDRKTGIPVFDNSKAFLVFSIGINDIGYAGADYTATNFKRDYRIILDYAIANGWKSNKIIIVAPSYIGTVGKAYYPTVNGGTTITDARILEYTVAAEDIANEYSIAFADYKPAIIAAGGDILFLPGDGIHPTNAGHAVIANYMTNFIEDNLFNKALAVNGDVSLNGSTETGVLNVTGPVSLDAKNGNYLLFKTNGINTTLLSNNYNIFGSGTKDDFNTYVFGDNPYSIYTNNTKRIEVNSSAITSAVPYIGTSGSFAGNISASALSGNTISLVSANQTLPHVSARFNSSNGRIGFNVANSNGFSYISYNANPVSGSDNTTYDLSQAATRLRMDSGMFQFARAAAGTAGNAITWTNSLVIDASGNSEFSGSVTVPAPTLGGHAVNKTYADATYALTGSYAPVSGSVNYFQNQAATNQVVLLQGQLSVYGVGGVGTYPYNDRNGDGLIAHQSSTVSTLYTGEKIRFGNNSFTQTLRPAILTANSDITLGNGSGVIMFISDVTSAPSSSTATGAKGEVRIVGTDRYECTDTNTWVKSTVVVTF